MVLDTQEEQVQQRQDVLREPGDLNGFMNIYKPAKFTSHDVVAVLRKSLPKKTKVGHTGTLDPDATGILPICIGKATRLAEYFTAMPKTYLGELTLGATTDTQDGSGQILTTASPLAMAALTLEGLLAILPGFIGKIQQVPPMVSAIKINGQRLYDLARQGKTVDRPARQVEIFDIQVVSADFSLPCPKISLKVVCGSGTYIRTLFHDLGEALQVGGYMSALERQAVGRFTLATAFTLAEAQAGLQQQNYSLLLPLTLGVEQLPKVILTSARDYEHICYGRPVVLALDAKELPVCQIEYANKLLGVGIVKPMMSTEDGFLERTEPPLPGAEAVMVLKIHKNLIELQK